jgi:serine/threonine protein kinase
MQDQPSGRPAAVLEQPTLASVLRDLPHLSDDAADAVVREVAARLDELHRDGRVHGDLRPATVRLAADDERVVARIDGPDGGGAIAPECLRGAPPDARSDVFALGVLACTALTGQHPFRGATREQVEHATLAGRYGPLRDLPDPMAAAIDGALRVDPRHRTANVADFLALWTEGRPEPTIDPDLLRAVKSSA